MISQWITYFGATQYVMLPDPRDTKFLKSAELGILGELLNGHIVEPIFEMWQLRTIKLQWVPRENLLTNLSPSHTCVGFLGDEATP